MAEEIEWKCTDANNEQYGRRLSEHLFEFKEKNRSHEINDEGEWIQITVDLNEYTWEQIHKHVIGYYKSMDELFEYSNSSSSWIIAEIIFEQESGLY